MMVRGNFLFFLWSVAFLLWIRVVHGGEVEVDAEEEVVSSSSSPCLNDHMKVEMEENIRRLQRGVEESEQELHKCRLLASQSQEDVDRLSLKLKAAEEKNLEYGRQAMENHVDVNRKKELEGELNRMRDMLSDARTQIQNLQEKTLKSDSQREVEMKETIYSLEEEIKELKASLQENTPSLDYISTWASSKMDDLQKYDYEALVKGMMKQASRAFKDGAESANVYVEQLNVQTEPVRKYAVKEMDKYTTVVMDAYDSHCREHVDPVLASIEPHIHANLPKVKRSMFMMQDWIMQTVEENRKKAVAALSKSNQSWARNHAAEIVDFVIGGCTAPLMLLMFIATFKVAFFCLGLLCCCWCCGTRRANSSSRRRKSRTMKRGNKMHQD